ncbi:unnamed protein product [Parascedosporium putredinis]|uniref:DUF1996 domain-containing protein n=1 Tax=Parascedosporium putredinis TaxID=1442378 RepID=A0A9P1GUD9_9PEZI|nr:unnamed protein product [Parascedosporium putredinis]CAI7987572.1 unnamed protein product [Parascedosporium putredinis]
MLTKTYIAALLSAVGVDAFWRMECPHRLGLARIDPLVNPGTASAHAHAIYGSNGFSLTSGFDQLAGGDCTSCRVKQDKSAYWHPQLYFKDAATGEFEEVKPSAACLPTTSLMAKTFSHSPGFRMIAGDTKRRDFTAPWDYTGPDPEKSTWRGKGYVEQSILKQLAIGVNCLNYAKPGEPTLMRHYLPDKAFIDENCPDGIRFELMFPSCWVGNNVITSANHQDHVAYPDTVMDGPCPADFPVRLPGLMFESFYNTVEFKGRSGSYVLANDDTQGFGYHGDFISGWDEETLRQAVNTCTNMSGRIDDCPVFELQSQNDAAQCNLNTPSLLSSENVFGPMAVLPGLGKIVEDIIGGITDGIADIVDPILGKGDDAQQDASPGGGVFKEDPVPVNIASEDTKPEPQPQPEPEPEPTTQQPEPEPVVTPAPEPVVEENLENVISTQYVRDGNVMSKILWVQEVVWVTEYSPDAEVSTATVDGSARKAKRSRRHAHGHLHRRH